MDTLYGEVMAEARAVERLGRQVAGAIDANPHLDWSGAIDAAGTALDALNALARALPDVPRPVHELLHEELVIGDLRILKAGRIVAVGNNPVRLPRIVFDLLAVLAESPGRCYPKAELLDRVWNWPPERQGATRTVDSHASRLRCALEEAGSCVRVENVWGVGYKLVPMWPTTVPAVA